MNYCNYYVKEVKGKPKKKVFVTPNGINHIWWDVEITYIYDNGELRTRNLSFKTEKSAYTVKKGYHFLA